ncbi:MAG: DUF4292 domain-containing protein [Gemmatimonadota bacterium]|nr:DUF4292 domain-containing protein [Gemmatimonadota bacterium]
MARQQRSGTRSIAWKPALCLFLLVFSGCAASLSRLSEIPPPSSPADLLRIVSSRSDDLLDLEVRAGIDMRVDGVKQNGVVVLFHRSPDALKIEMKVLFSSVLSALARGDSLAVFLARTNHYLEGPSEDVLRTVTGVDLTPYGAREAILGLVNLSPLSLPRIGEYATHRDSLVVEIIEPLWTRRLRFDPRTAVLLEERVYSPQGVLVSRRMLSDYQLQNGVALPRRMEIVQDSNRIRIQVISRKVNSGVPEGRFQLKVPGDVIRVE